jgi:hypothetical protein
LNEEEKERKGSNASEYKYQAVKTEIINPKSISIDELFGYLDDQSPP